MNTLTTLAAALGLVATPPTINLDLGPPQVASAGQLVKVTLTATGDDQPWYVVDAVLQWDPAVLRLVGVESPVNLGPPPYDYTGDLWLSCLCWAVDLNDTWDDGDAVYTALGSIVAPPVADADGMPVAVLVFEAIGMGTTAIEIIPAAGEWAVTDVLTLDGDVLGATHGTTVTVAYSKAAVP